MHLQRRHFLTMLAAGTVAAATGCAAPVADHRSDAFSTDSPPQPPAPSRDHPPSRPFGPRTLAAKSPAHTGPLTSLPASGNTLALTIDDGVDSNVVGAYIKFAADTGARLTFFVTAVYESWRTHRHPLRPLVDSGQRQLGNHTWDHPDLTTLSASQIADQLTRTKTFLQSTFGVDGTPFYRPPYGYHNATVDTVAADHGYTTPTLWNGSLSDSTVITEQYLLRCARQYFRPHAIIIGHANHPPVTHLYGQLVEIIRDRHLTPVTLNDTLQLPIPRGDSRR